MYFQSNSRATVCCGSVKHQGWRHSDPGPVEELVVVFRVGVNSKPHTPTQSKTASVSVFFAYMWLQRRPARPADDRPLVEGGPLRFCQEFQFCPPCSFQSPQRACGAKQTKTLCCYIIKTPKYGAFERTTVENTFLFRRTVPHEVDGKGCDAYADVQRDVCSKFRTVVLIQYD
jgi:hypothetical protein